MCASMLVGRSETLASCVCLSGGAPQLNLGQQTLRGLLWPWLQASTRGTPGSTPSEGQPGARRGPSQEDDRGRSSQEEGARGGAEQAGGSPGEAAGAGAGANAAEGVPTESQELLPAFTFPDQFSPSLITEGPQSAMPWRQQVAALVASGEGWERARGMLPRWCVECVLQDQLPQRDPAKCGPFGPRPIRPILGLACCISSRLPLYSVLCTPCISVSFNQMCSSMVTSAAAKVLTVCCSGGVSRGRGSRVPAVFVCALRGCTMHSLCAGVASSCTQQTAPRGTSCHKQSSALPAFYAFRRCGLETCICCPAQLFQLPLVTSELSLVQLPLVLDEP